MKSIREITRLALFFFAVGIASCSDDSDNANQNLAPSPNPNPNSGTGGAVTITSVTTGPVFWGEELTITGSGFSTNKNENVVKFTSVSPTSTFCDLNYTSEGGDIEVISATSTQLVIKVPFKSQWQCGPESATIEVSVKDDKASIPDIKFIGLPFVDGFLYHFGWFDHPGVTKIDDSVMIDGGIRGYSARTSGYWDKVRLDVNGISVPIKYRSIGLESGWAFHLPAKDFGNLECSDEPDGWGARKMTFTISIEGTDKSASNELYVQNLPVVTAECADCPGTLSKSAGGNTSWKISGKNMYYTKVVFTPTPSPNSQCDHAPQSMEIVSDAFTDELEFTIPLELLEGGCGYDVTLFDFCDQGKTIGGIDLAP